MAKSTVQPKQIEFLRYEGNMSLYRLTKILGQEEYTNDFTSEKLVIYNYDEYMLELSTTSTLENEIKNNFEVYWNMAKEQTTEKADLKRKLEKYKEYQKDGRLVDMIIMAGNQITELILSTNGL